VPYMRRTEQKCWVDSEYAVVDVVLKVSYMEMSWLPRPGTWTSSKWNRRIGRTPTRICLTDRRVRVSFS